MSEQRPNTYDDDDLAAKLEEIEALIAQKASIMATAMGECAKISEKIKTAKKEAKDDLSIPLKVLNPLLKRRKLEREIEKIDESIDEDFADVWADASGQFCMFAPVEDAAGDTVN